jgi:hypothetical protein
MPESRKTYFDLLQLSLRPSDFLYGISNILNRDPLFIPGYLEHIWSAQERHDRSLVHEIIKSTKKVVAKLFIDRDLQQRVADQWCDVEQEALKELIDLHYQYTNSFFGRCVIGLQRAVVDHWFDIKVRRIEQDRKYVKLMKIVDSNSLFAEISGVATHWWNIETIRAMSIAYHQYTHTIPIRNRIGDTEEYIPADGVHESVTTKYAHMFPRIHETVLRFAHEEKLALGRVVIVRLQPGEQSYRHYDPEIFLRGRKRFHLVVQAGPRNILSAGDETSNVRPGEIWFFANKVMHRAHNKSNVPRIHVIFDGYPLDSVYE